MLADLGNIYRWNPGDSHSNTTYENSKYENSKGEDATRHCDIERPLKGYLEERTFDWREGEGYKIAIYDTNFSNKDTVIDFSVRAEGDGTKVEVSPEYELKFGLLGKLMDRLFFERQFRKGMTRLLSRLKYHVETGEEVLDQVPTEEQASHPQQNGSNRSV